MNLDIVNNIMYIYKYQVFINIISESILKKKEIYI